MGLEVVDDAAALELHKETGTHYILFFASGTPPWCSDCREAEPHIQRVFGVFEAPTLNVVRVGMKEEWKALSNRWRKEPYKVASIPTIIKVVDGQEAARLGENECKSETNLRGMIANLGGKGC